ncbi:MAG TPA: ParB/RepB/Spo0J family partition protein [Polyangiaceae bacterium]
MTPPEKRRALGRGLDALLPDAPGTASASTGKEPVFVCPIERIVPRKGQPRQRFDDEKLEELARSIREHGVLEPIVVRRAAAGASTIDSYEIIAGERRWRAAQRAGLRELLVVVKDVSPRDAFELALIENVQREDLNPVELAEALDRLVREHGYTQEALADRLGKDRATIANSLRLLKLPPRVRQMVIEGSLSEGHARALLGASDAKLIEALADKVLRGALSVRATERLVRVRKKTSDASPEGGASKKSASTRDLEARLTRHLGTRVEVHDHAGKGEIAVRYGSLDELDRLLDLILRTP